MCQSHPAGATCSDFLLPSVPLRRQGLVELRFCFTTWNVAAWQPNYWYSLALLRGYFLYANATLDTLRTRPTVLFRSGPRAVSKHKWHLEHRDQLWCGRPALTAL